MKRKKRKLSALPSLKSVKRICYSLGPLEEGIVIVIEILCE